MSVVLLERRISSRSKVECFDLWLHDVAKTKKSLLLWSLFICILICSLSSNNQNLTLYINNYYAFSTEIYISNTSFFLYVFYKGKNKMPIIWIKQLVGRELCWEEYLLFLPHDMVYQSSFQLAHHGFFVSKTGTQPKLELLVSACTTFLKSPTSRSWYFDSFF